MKKQHCSSPDRALQYFVKETVEVYIWSSQMKFTLQGTKHTFKIYAVPAKAKWSSLKYIDSVVAHYILSDYSASFSS